MGFAAPKSQPSEEHAWKPSKTGLARCAVAPKSNQPDPFPPPTFNPSMDVVSAPACNSHFNSRLSQPCNNGPLPHPCHHGPAGLHSRVQVPTSRLPLTPIPPGGAPDGSTGSWERQKLTWAGKRELRSGATLWITELRVTRLQFAVIVAGDDLFSPRRALPLSRCLESQGGTGIPHAHTHTPRSSSGSHFSGVSFPLSPCRAPTSRDCRLPVVVSLNANYPQTSLPPTIRPLSLGLSPRAESASPHLSSWIHTRTLVAQHIFPRDLPCYLISSTSDGELAM